MLKFKTHGLRVAAVGGYRNPSGPGTVVLPRLPEAVSGPAAHRRQRIFRRRRVLPRQHARPPHSAIERAPWRGGEIGAAPPPDLRRGAPRGEPGRPARQLGHWLVGRAHHGGTDRATL